MLVVTPANKRMKMSTSLDKLIRANELIMEVEQELLDKSGFCPYEIGNTLRNLEEAIVRIQTLEEKGY